MTGVIARYGVLGVFVLMVPESACIPIPSEVTLLFSGFSVREGWMSFQAASLRLRATSLAH
jgi:membrane protein DedA with SNARE-associated domain